MSDVDRLMIVNMATFTEYLRNVVYPKMAQHATTSDVVAEICTRHDRGVISPGIVPHAVWINIDKNGKRPGLNLDVLIDEIPQCDVLISTAILHHTPPQHTQLLMERLCGAARKKVVLSGPNVDFVPDLIGDHEYHIDVAEIVLLAHDNGFSPERIERIGLSEPFCGVMMAFGRR